MRETKNQSINVEKTNKQPRTGMQTKIVVGSREKKTRTEEREEKK
jgi:hypothetical protein